MERVHAFLFNVLQRHSDADDVELDVQQRRHLQFKLYTDGVDHATRNLFH